MVEVLSKPGCVQCNATYRMLDSKGVPYRVVNMAEDPEALERAKNLGYTQAPVVIAGDDHWSGFQPDKINGLNATPSPVLR